MDSGKRMVLYSILYAAIVTGCVSAGVLNGRLSIAGQPPAPMVFHFRSDRAGYGGTISTTLPDGEMLSGRYLQITSTTSENVVGPMLRPWDPYWNSWGPYGYPGSQDGSYSSFVTNYSGKVIATLFGNRESTMRCRFRLSDPLSGLSGGGAGECQLSQGGTVAVQF